MSDRATAANPEVLVWARERAGLTLSDVASHFNKTPEQVAAWESGEDWPTFNQLDRLAKAIYHRPVALFFLPEPPEEAAPEQEFRTLPDFDVAHLKADTRLAVRLGRAYQDSLRELTGGTNPANKQLLRELKLTVSSGPVMVAKSVRDYLGVSLGEQSSWRGSSGAMANWRTAVEEAGVFVFKRSFKQKEVFGFCLEDDVFPIIMVNNGATFTRQVFTLFHELAHLLAGVSSITTMDGSFVERMSGPSRRVEVACNQFAAEFLVPAESFPWSDVNRDDLERSIEEIARWYNVSREVILRRILDRGWVDSATYDEYVTKWAGDGGGREGEGGNYYYNQATYLGGSYLRLAFSRYRAGLIPLSELADHLGVKAKNVGQLESTVAGRL